MIVEIDRKADKAIDKIDNKQSQIIRKFLKDLKKTSSFFDTTFEKLQGSKTDYKYRIGSYRIVLEKVSNTHVRITAIAHRKDIYRLLLGIAL